MRSREFWLLWLDAKSDAERADLIKKYVAGYVQVCCTIDNKKLRKRCVARALNTLFKDLAEVLRNEAT